MAFWNRLTSAWSSFWNPEPIQPHQEQIIDSLIWNQPYTGPLDLDNYGRETATMRRQYREYFRTEPAVASAVSGKVAAIAGLDTAVQPASDSPADKLAAKLCFAAVDESIGFPALISRILLPAFLDGFSICEKVMDPDPNLTGFTNVWGVLDVKNKDTAYLRFSLDEGRNINAIVSTARGLQSYDPSKCIVYTHNELYSNPFGASDLRAAARSSYMINAAYTLWGIALNNFAAPFLKGKSKQGNTRAQLKDAMTKARNQGFLVLPSAEDEVEILNFATATSFQAFEAKVDRCRQEIFLAIRGAFLPFTEGSTPNARGNVGVNKVASDSFEYLICKSVSRCISKQLFPDIVRPNLGYKVGIPRLSLGGVDWTETNSQLDAAKKILVEFRQPISRKYIERISSIEFPVDDADAILPPPLPMASQAPGMAPQGGQMPGLGFTATFSQDKLPVSAIHADPDRLQFRDFDGPDGLTDDRRTSEPYDPAKAGTIMVWRDPEDGFTYVVDGHQRLAAAKRDGVFEVPVMWLPKLTADQAREVGRIMNAKKFSETEGTVKKKMRGSSQVQTPSGSPT